MRKSLIFVFLTILAASFVAGQGNDEDEFQKLDPSEATSESPEASIQDQTTSEAVIEEQKQESGTSGDSEASTVSDDVPGSVEDVMHHSESESDDDDDDNDDNDYSSEFNTTIAYGMPKNESTIQSIILDVLKEYEVNGTSQKEEDHKGTEVRITINGSGLQKALIGTVLLVVSGMFL